MPGDRNLLSLDASLAIPVRVLRFEVSGLRRRTLVTLVHLNGQTGTHWSDRSDPPVRPVRPTGQTRLELLHLHLRSWLCGSTKEPSGFLVNHRKPRARCSLRQLPLMTRLPRSPGTTLVLRLNQEIVHDFILLFMPPCGPHLTPLATGSLE
jgi:hypothetical protein